MKSSTKKRGRRNKKDEQEDDAVNREVKDSYEVKGSKG